MKENECAGCGKDRMLFMTKRGVGHEWLCLSCILTGMIQS